MKGFIYMDNDYNLHMRPWKFVEEDDPGFWTRNWHLIDTVWKFDTEEPDSMRRMLESFRSKELNGEKVRWICNQIGFDLNAFVAANKTPKVTFSIPESQILNADPIQPR